MARIGIKIVRHKQGGDCEFGVDHGVGCGSNILSESYLRWEAWWKKYR